MTTYTLFEQQPNYPIEAHRYRLIRAAVCPYAHRTTIARELLGLDKIISLGTVDSVNTPEGWQFSLDENKQDPILKVNSVPEIYHHTNPDYDGPYSVPILVDKTTHQIVNKESMEIMHDFATKFREFHSEDAPDIYPEPLQEEIDIWNNEIADKIADGVYKIGFTQDQEEYEVLLDNFFTLLDDIDQRLAKQPYMHGDTITETDIILYTPLVRLDIVYNPIYSVNKKRLTDYPNLWPYMKKLYKHPAFYNTTDFDAIKAGYYTGTAADILHREIIPLGPELSHWNERQMRIF